MAVRLTPDEVNGRIESLERWNSLFDEAIAQGQDHAEAAQYADSDGMVNHSTPVIDIGSALPRTANDLDPWATAKALEIEELKQWQLRQNA